MAVFGEPATRQTAPPLSDSHDLQEKPSMAVLGILPCVLRQRCTDSHAPTAPVELTATKNCQRWFFRCLPHVRQHLLAMWVALFPYMLHFGRLKHCYACSTVLKFCKNCHWRFFFNPYSRNFPCNPILVYIIHSFIILKLKNGTTVHWKGKNDPHRGSNRAHYMGKRREFRIITMMPPHFCWKYFQALELKKFENAENVISPFSFLCVFPKSFSMKIFPMSIK